MNKANDNVSTNRRALLKRATIAAAAVASSGIASSAQSQNSEETPIEARGNFLPAPKQVAVSEGVLPLTDGAGLYYWDTGGNGPVIVLSHPGRGSALSWPYQQPVFATAGFRTIAYSRRSRYGSPSGSTENKGNLADDLNALMMHLNVDKFHILGLAAGGFAVSDYAVSYPGRLLSMVIACSLFGLWDKNIDSRSDFILPKSFADLPPEFKELGPAYRWAHPQGVQAWIEMEENSKGKGPNIWQQAKSEITWDKLRKLNIPTLFVTGGADLYQPPSMMRAAARELPGSETLVVPEAGHAVQWEQPEVFNQAVLAFFKQHSPSHKL